MRKATAPRGQIFRCYWTWFEGAKIRNRCVYSVDLFGIQFAFVSFVPRLWQDVMRISCRFLGKQNQEFKPSDVKRARKFKIEAKASGRQLSMAWQARENSNPAAREKAKGARKKQVKTAERRQRTHARCQHSRRGNGHANLPA